MAVAIPAATLVIMRERVDAAPDLLMLERAGTMTFAPGALVFPGGRVDAGDRALADASGWQDMEEGAARIAAIRETLEEAGVPVGLSPLPDSSTVAAMRAGLHAGTPFAAVLERAGVTPDLTVLTPFARWRPDLPGARVFDTRFYLTSLPAGAGAGRVDGTEHARLFWANAARVLADADTGRGTLIYPTRRNLERLARFASHAEAVADAVRHPIRTITPFVTQRDGRDMLCIPDDLGYPVTAEPLRTVRRG